MSKCKSYINIIKNIEEIKYRLEVLGLKSFREKITEDKDYLLMYKTLTSADIPTKCKCAYDEKDKEAADAFSNKKLEYRAKKNVMFYTTAKDMIKYEKYNQDKKMFFCQTKQSNIYLPKQFYDFLEVSQPDKKETVMSSNNIKTYIFAEYISKYFNCNITNTTLRKLGKTEQAAEIDLKAPFMEISLTTGVHGIGRKKDDIFHKIRQNTFVNDRIVILIEKTNNFKTIFITFIRNPKFFEINDILNEEYYQSFIDKEDVDDKLYESRKGQAKWREMLADYYISDKQENERIIRCPFTETSVNYEQEGTILRASHIKAYSTCKKDSGEINITEAYDINNGFLVTANVDALFDKYMISVEPNTLKILCSKKISRALKEKIGLLQKLSEKPSEIKRKYLEIHYNEFKKRESER